MACPGFSSLNISIFRGAHQYLLHFSFELAIFMIYARGLVTLETLKHPLPKRRVLSSN
jgi:hypothetical protein